VEMGPGSNMAPDVGLLTPPAHLGSRHKTPFPLRRKGDGASTEEPREEDKPAGQVGREKLVSQPY
jgi:hypothetical protein